jgi:hypothetical protein
MMIGLEGEFSFTLLFAEILGRLSSRGTIWYAISISVP